MSVKDSQLIFQFGRCKKNYDKDCNKVLIKRFANTYIFCNGDICFVVKKGCLFI